MTINLRAWIERLEKSRATTSDGIRDVDPDLARRCLVQAEHEIAYLAGEWATRDDGFRYMGFQPHPCENLR
jgi:hypothetical protein